MSEGEVGGTATTVALAPGEESAVFQALRGAFPAAEIAAGSSAGHSWAVVPAGSLIEICRYLRDEPALDFKMLLDITAVDLLPRAPRWQMVYHLLSLSRNDRYRLKVEVADGASPQVPSILSLWPAAGFFEREVYDLMGIGFEGHPDLRRIMLPDDWVGHPLRFDHPLGGEDVSFTS